ncbi:MAG: 6,7-dimethyl-8-ribityllumazine synthase [Spirochaetia bacterium]|nr:6,7-dimethyl-8-ribityllumazine synthase [Spirochaetia bacterium]
MSDIPVFSGKIKIGKVYNIAIVVSAFNSMITDSLLNGAIGVLSSHGIEAPNCEVYKVPGAFEIPVTCKRIFSGKNIDGIIALGAVIRGETPHFDFVAGECASGVQKVSLEFGKPVSFGVLTTDNVDQALNRAGLKYGNKGADVAGALLQLLYMYDEASI